MSRIGTIHPAKALFFRVRVGEAKDEDGREYEMATNIDGKLLVRSGKTGKWWCIGWSELLTLAVEAGVDEE